VVVDYINTMLAANASLMKIFDRKEPVWCLCAHVCEPPELDLTRSQRCFERLISSPPAPLLPQSTDPMFSFGLDDSSSLVNEPCRLLLDDLPSYSCDLPVNQLSAEEVDLERKARKNDVEVSYEKTESIFAIVCEKLERKNHELVPSRLSYLWDVDDKLANMPPGAFVHVIDYRRFLAFDEKYMQSLNYVVTESSYNGQACLLWTKIGEIPKFNERWEALEALKRAPPGVGIRIAGKANKTRSGRITKQPDRFHY